MTGGKTLLSARGLTVERGGRDLFVDLDLSVATGEVLHVRGENGAGKTTLLRILAGLSRFGFSGVVERAAPSLFVAHQPAVKGLLTVRENLAWHPSGDSLGDAAALREALTQIGLAGYEEVPAARLSAGQQRRVNLARLFLSERPLWLLDEPFTALDSAGVRLLTDRMLAHAAAGGAVLLTSHQPVDAGGALRLLDLDRGAQRE